MKNYIVAETCDSIMIQLTYYLSFYARGTL